MSTHRGRSRKCSKAKSTYQIELFTKTFHKRFKPRPRTNFTKSYSKPDPERFCYGCGSKDHVILKCPDPKKRGDKDKGKDKTKKIYFKSDKKEKALFGMPCCSDSSDNEEEAQERQGMAGVAICFSCSSEASTPQTKSSAQVRRSSPPSSMTSSTFASCQGKAR